MIKFGYVDVLQAFLVANEFLGTTKHCSSDPQCYLTKKSSGCVVTAIRKYEFMKVWGKSSGNFRRSYLLELPFGEQKKKIYNIYIRFPTICVYIRGFPPFSHSKKSAHAPVDPTMAWQVASSFRHPVARYKIGQANTRYSDLVRFFAPRLPRPNAFEPVVVESSGDL